MHPKTSLSILAILLSLETISSINFKPQEHKTGLIFVKLAKARVSYDSHTVVYHVDISEFKTISSSVERGIADVEKYCKDLTCGFIIQQLRGQLLHMERDEQDIEAYQQFKRPKRAIEWMGSVFHWAFGLMDADTARKYDDAINSLNNNTERLHNIEKNQITLIQETIKVTNGTANQLKKQIHELEFQNESIQKKTLTIELVLYTNDLVMKSLTIIKLMILEHQRIAKQLVQLLEDSISGKITQLVPIERLSKDLTTVEHELHEDQRLPINIDLENPLHVFKYTTIRASLFKNRLLIEITIPVIEVEHFSIYQIIPVPNDINGYHTLIIPSTKFVLINNKNNEYIPITNEEYTNSETNAAGEKIIKPEENSHADYSKNCEISILINPEKDSIGKTCDVKLIPTSNYFIPINNNDLYYVSISRPMVILEHCHGHPSTSHELTESGMLRLEKNCRINADKINIRPRNNFKYNSTSSEDIKLLTNSTIFTTIEILFDKITSFNKTKIPTSHKTMLIRDDVNDYNRLAKEAEDLMEKTKYEDRLKEIHYDDFIHSIGAISISTIILIIGIIILIIFLYKKFFSRGLWTQLADFFESESFVPKIFIKQNFPTTPYTARKAITSDHEMQSL